MGVISLRISDSDQQKLDELSREEHKDKSSVARELIRYGWEFLMIRQYRYGKLSIGLLAEKLALSISETIDLLAEFGIEAPIEYDDYLKGFDVLNERNTGRP